jgi:hypothetical protein
MFGLVENENYFQFIWDDLSRFRFAVVDRLLQRARDKADVNAEVAVQSEVPEMPGVTLRDFAKRVVNSIVQSVPHMYGFLRAFPGPKEKLDPPDTVNMADFLLFMHFALGCLHRQTHFASRDERDSRNSVAAQPEYRTSDPAPFCADRFEMPKNKVHPEGARAGVENNATEVGPLAIQKARMALGCARRVASVDWLRAFVVPYVDILPRSHKDEFQYITRMESLRMRAKQIVDRTAVNPLRYKEAVDLAKEIASEEGGGELKVPKPGVTPFRTDAVRSPTGGAPGVASQDTARQANENASEPLDEVGPRESGSTAGQA